MDIQRHQVPIDIHCFLWQVLTFVSITEGEVGVDILTVVLDGFFEDIDGASVLLPDIVQNTSIIKKHRVVRLEVHS